MLENLDGIEIRAITCPSFESVLAPVLTQLEGCTWAFEGSAPFGSHGPVPFPDDEELLTLFEVEHDRSERAVWDVGWLRPRGIQRMLPFVLSDWLEVYAVNAPAFPRHWVAEQTIRPLSSLPGLLLYLECVDAAFWRAWSPIPAILSSLRTDVRARPARWSRG